MREVSYRLGVPTVEGWYWFHRLPTDTVAGIVRIEQAGGIVVEDGFKAFREEWERSEPTGEYSGPIEQPHCD